MLSVSKRNKYNTLISREAFFRRIISSQILSNDKQFFTPLETLVTPGDFNQCLEFVLNLAKCDNKQDMRLRLLHKNFLKLKPGHTLRISKDKFGLPRSMYIFRTSQGEYHLLLETKSKLANGDKNDDLEIGEGSYKRGKPDWKVDGTIEPYYNLVSTLGYQYKHNSPFNMLKKEVKMSHQVKCEFVNSETYLSSMYKTTNGSSKEFKASVLGPKADMDLHDFVINYEATFGKPMSDAIKNQLITQAIVAVSSVHKQQIIHHDIKPLNFLVYQSSSDHPIAKLTDFGIGVKQNDITKEDEPLMAIGLHSPEVAHYFSDKNNDYYEQYHDEDVSDFLGPYYYRLNKASFFSKVPREDFKRPHSANDVWLLGLLIYFIKYGEYFEASALNLNRIHNDPLLSKMLAFHRSDRISAHRALELFKDTCSEGTLNTQTPTKSRCSIANDAFIPLLTLSKLIKLEPSTYMSLVTRLLEFLDKTSKKMTFCERELNLANIRVYCDKRKGFVFRYSNEHATPEEYFLSPQEVDEHDMFNNNWGGVLATLKPESRHYKTHQSAQYSWQLGILLYRLKYDAFPGVGSTAPQDLIKNEISNIGKDPLLKKLLDKNPSLRPSFAEAKSIHLKRLHIQPTPAGNTELTNLPTKKRGRSRMDGESDLTGIKNAKSQSGEEKYNHSGTKKRRIQMRDAPQCVQSAHPQLARKGVVKMSF